MNTEQKERLIRERIREVANSGEKELDLSNLGLDTIPEEVFELDKLEVFKFMGNMLVEVPYELTRMRKLKAFYLSHNRIREIEKDILIDLPYLNCLDLGDNPFNYYKAADYFYKNNPWQGYGKCLEEVDKAKNYDDNYFFFSGVLHVFPKEIFDLTKLTTLSLHGENITEIPLGISRLTNLKWLDLSSNKLSSLPVDIADLKQLHYISLDHNQLEEFPEVLLKLPALRQIHLNYNKIHDFPVSVILDERFSSVMAYDNPIRNFSSSFFNLPLEEMRHRFRC